MPPQRASGSDPHEKKTVRLRHDGRDLSLRVAHDLFSSHAVDDGTLLLLKTLAADPPPPGASVLDVGCGYGPLGLALAAPDESSSVEMLDRDALAVRYASENAALNGLANVVAHGGLGYEDAAADCYDLVVSNIPAKAGAPVIEHLLRGACTALRPGGRAAVVVIAPIAEFARSVIEATPEATITLVREAPGYTAFHYAREGSAPTRRADAFARGVYFAREDVVWSHGGRAFNIAEAHGIDDEPSPTEELLAAKIAAEPLTHGGRALCINVGQGYVPLAVFAAAAPREITLADRDLLALRTAERNLRANGSAAVALHHADSAPEARADLIAGVLREEEGAPAVSATVRRACAALEPGGVLLLAGSSTGITRSLKMVQSERLARVTDRTRRHGHSVLTATR